MKLLLTGDLHIGRSSSRVSHDVVAPEDLRTATAWNRIVALALHEQVAVVVLSGDIADQANKFWEAIGPLERGVHQLADAGIKTIAVTGNHDFDVLLKLADQLPAEQFSLLGKGGNWERTTIDQDGRPALHIDGWSFPTERVHRSPLDTYDLPADPSTPTLGVVHGDLDAPNSPYAPLDLTRLQMLPPNGWLLGHIHVPRLIDGTTWVLYPGSPQAMDPGESGLHGPWIVEMDRGKLSIPQQHPLSTVWYDQHTVDLSGTQDDDTVYSTVLQHVRDKANAIVAESSADLAHISLRLRLEGSTAVAHRVHEIVKPMTAELGLRVGNASMAIESLDVQVTPAINLKELSSTNTAPGAVARMLVELQQAEPSPEVLELIREARSELSTVANAKEFTNLQQHEITDDMARDYLQSQGRKLMTHLVNQQA